MKERKEETNNEAKKKVIKGQEKDEFVPDNSDIQDRVFLLRSIFKILQERRSGLAPSLCRLPQGTYFGINFDG